MTQPPSAIRAVVVGAGAIATGSHLPALAAVGDRVAVEAIVDVDAERVEKAATAWGIPRQYRDLHRMLDEVAPDLVVVCTPPTAHRDAVIASLDKGAWVWCEKPPTLSLAEFDEVVGHEGDGGPYAAYVFQHRFGSAARHLRALVGEGALGAPRVAICNTLWYRDAGYFAVPWRGTWAGEGGGPTMGHGIHQMDLLLHVLGDWSRVQALMATSARVTETEDVSLATVALVSGAVVSITNSLLSPRETSYLRFDFDDATVEVEHLYGYDNSHWRWTPAPHVTDAARIASWAPPGAVGSSHRAQLESLLDSMEKRERPVASGADGRRVLQLAAGMYRSAFTGEPVLRSDVGPGDPFYATMSGGDLERARRVLTRTRTAPG
ncbi:oxidoreductase [Pseudonocardia sp. CNS-004]|nr:oxidoreductase [Pseudonocardia sp. CNS-004]